MATAVARPSVSKSEHDKRERRKTSYHLVASKNKLPTDPEEDSDFLYHYLTSSRPGRKSTLDIRIQTVKRQLLLELAKTEGVVETKEFSSLLEELMSLRDPSRYDARMEPHSEQEAQLEGMWITLSKPKFPDCLGRNESGDYLYTLGRLSFDMFRPTRLVCSIQGIFNPVHEIKERAAVLNDRVPKRLLNELKVGNGILRSYTIVTAIAVEPWNSELMGASSPNSKVRRPIEGLITTNGYALANPKKSNRLSVWFTGGTIEARGDSDVAEWLSVFSDAPQRVLKEKARVLGARLVMGATPPQGMESDGKMSYELKRPIGGHDTAYVDLLYLDDTVRIVKTNTGTVHVMARVPHFPDE